MLGATQASAQDAPGDTLEEIVVTARKRSEPLQNVPISITALTRTDIENKGAARVADILTSVPNLNFEPTSLGSADVNIRGISSSTNNFGIESAVGLYVDEFYLSRPTAFNPAALDLERVEVLRGPQGTLFGRNTIAGVISFVTANPDKQFTAQGDLTFGSEDLRQYRASVSGPIGDMVGFRVSAARIESDGWFKNATPGVPKHDGRGLDIGPRQAALRAERGLRPDPGVRLLRRRVGPRQ
jgi:iron complex outermembrane receptor protein